MYIGTIVNDGERKDVDRFVVNVATGRKLDLAASLKIVNHSPTGFCWGYAGSGPAQLALAMLLDYFKGDREAALSLYQDFKFKVIAQLPMDEDFSLDITRIENAITEINIARMRADGGSPSRIKDDPDEMERLISEAVTRMGQKRCGTCGKLHVADEYYNHNFVARGNGE